ncbi:Low molecular weight protein tyrosine phosphatase [Streptococcus sp. DD12]|nr:Low molecular weight protein tyrosine phosphatase [Streptococcus sp. DD12]
MAESIMTHLNDGRFERIESRATSSWEHGNPIHAGTRSVLDAHQVPFNPEKRSQQITVEDLEDFDTIVAMDQQNLTDLQDLSAGRYDHKISRLLDRDVPDPWYTGDFEETFALLWQGCQDLRDKERKND